MADEYRKLLSRVVFLSVVLGTLAAFACAAQYGLASAASVIAGIALMLASFWAIVLFVSQLLDTALPQEKRVRAAILLGTKSIAMIMIVGVLITRGFVRGGGLVAGLSIVAVSIVAAGLIQSTMPEATPPVDRPDDSPAPKNPPSETDES